MTKFIFLDIDGVLNSTRSCLALGGYGFFPRISRMKGTVDFVEHAKLDPIAVLLLDRLVRSTGAHVVISSTWRMGSTLDEFNALFKAYIPNNAISVIDMTPVHNHGPRGDEIKAWLDLRSLSDDKYVILDDDSDMLQDQKPFFVHVDRDAGLSFENFQTAEFILKGENNVTC